MDQTTLDRLERTYAEAVPGLSVPWRAEPAPRPELLVLNEPLAGELGLAVDELREPAGIGFLTGAVPEDVVTAAQAYAGHQFGSYSPRLGDGRALLLGEVLDNAGRRRDLHLKGSGRTPFARGGDGRAVIGPMLREYVIGEALHGFGIPTTRALSVIATGESVLREGPQPGAVLCRVAASHLRVGTFEYAAATGDHELLTALTDYAIERHYPDVAGAERPALELLRRVAMAQAELVVSWMGVGFIHGVMNTDNMTISGESIDFGPCAFLEAFNPAAKFSSIDHGGRYAYGNQPGIAQWNLARLAEALLPLIDADQQVAVDLATAVLGEFGERYNTLALERLSAKFGLPEPDQELVEAGLALLQEQEVDFTSFFRALAAGTAAELFVDPDPFHAWAERREARLGPDRAAVAEAMNRINPAYIPRNHVLERALAEATLGDLTRVEHLVAAMRDPFTERPGFEDLAQPDPDKNRGFVTFCGT